MARFGDFLKSARKNAGLSQEQLAEKMNVSLTAVQKWESGISKLRIDKINDLAYYFNIPAESILKEMLADTDNDRGGNFPDFLFDEDTNRIVSRLHLNLKQQELFGLLCVYKDDFGDWLNNDGADFDLERLPYAFVKEVGSIQLMNLADGLKKVLYHIKKEFLLKVLRLYPEKEFDILKLPKPLICEFIDSGYYLGKGFEPDTVPEEELNFRINMRKAEKILPLLDKEGAVYLTDKLPDDPCVKDAVLSKELPKEFYEAYNGVKAEYAFQLTDVLETVTSCEVDETHRLCLKINEKGKMLCQWLKE